jgi:LacI family gluconate utilization system Gnt-I transcriptional repressor
MTTASLGSLRMDDVAREAGVARATVSRAINQPHLVAPATRAAVQAAIARLGYVPDLRAGSLASAGSKSRIVGAIVPTLSNAWFADTLDGLSAVLAAQGFQLLLGQTRYDPALSNALLEAFLGRRVDALVLTGALHDADLRERLRRLGLPVVETWDLPADPVDMAVGFSNAGAGRAVAAHLVARQRRRIAFIGADEERSLQRLAGLREGLQAAGLPPPETELVPPPSSIADGGTLLKRLLERVPGLDAVFCNSDTLAVGALFECQRRGLDVPGRLALVGFSDQPIAAQCVPALSTVQVGARAIGEQAGRLLLQRLQGGAHAQASPRVMDLGFGVVPRQTS